MKLFSFLFVVGPVLLLRPVPVISSEAGDLVMRTGEQGFISSWLQLGPLAPPGKARWSQAKLVARDPLGISDLDEAPRHGARAAGGRWRVRHGPSTGLVLRGRGPATVYLAALLSTDRDRRLWLSLGSDGALEAWLRGKRLLSRPMDRRAVPDTDLVAIDCPRGESLLVLKLSNVRPGRWRVLARLMDESFEPPKGLRIILTGADTGMTGVLKRKGKLVLDRRVDLERGAVALAARISFPGGRPIGSGAMVKARFRGGEPADPLEREVNLSVESPADVKLGRFSFDGVRAPVTLEAGLDKADFLARLGFRPSHVKRLAKAHRGLSEAGQRSDLHETGLESVAWRIAHLKKLIESGDEDYRYLERETRKTAALARALSDGKDPYRGRRAEVQRRGYRSRVDGKLHYYTLYVPPGWREQGEKRFGLIVALHGLDGVPMGMMQTVFGVKRDKGETKLHRERYPGKVGPASVFVLAPGGMGNSSYRAYGEIDVLDAIDKVVSRYRIDTNKIYITGLSMGGIGAAAIPLHHQDLFAAAAPLCGYHSLFENRWLKGVEFKPWESFLGGVRSNAYWAENGRHLPLRVVHGLRDGPRHSRVLVERYRKLGYDIKYETPNLGHNVWRGTYHNRGIFKHFSRFRKDPHPRRVTLRTARLRYRSAYWVRIDDVDDYGSWSSIDATWKKDNTIIVETDNVRVFTVAHDDVLAAEKPVVFEVDGAILKPESSQTERWQLRRLDSGWELGPPPECAALCKRPGLAGPIGDAMFEPLLFVYGTSSAGEAALARRLIEEMRIPRSGVLVDWPVKADSEVTEKDIATKSLVLVGTVGGNALLGRIRDRLPIKIEEGAVVAGERRFPGASVAASFIYPNPLNSDRYVVVHTGTSLQALYHTAHLPQLLPDYIVYDASSWGRKRGMVLNEREHLAAGFFDRNWRL